MSTTDQLAQALEDVAKLTRHPDYDWPRWLQREVDEALAANRTQPASAPAEQAGAVYARGYEQGLNDVLSNGVEWARHYFTADDAAPRISPAQPASAQAQAVGEVYVPVGRFINIAAESSEEPHYGYVADEHADDPDVVVLYRKQITTSLPAFD